MASNKASTKKQNPGMSKGLIAVCAVGILVVVGIIAAIILLLSGGEAFDSRYPVEVNMLAVKSEINASQVGDFTETDEVTDYVKLTVAGHGEIVVRLREDIAPITVKNFKNLVEKKFYDGLTFHRVVQSFMIQGGDPEGNGTGGSTPIKGEFSANGWDNQLSHLRGVISMARGSHSMDSGSCQFFICTSSNYAESSLDGQYASFGYVVAGMSTVDSIAKVEVEYNSTKTEKSSPVERIVIEKVRFVTPDKA